MNKKKVIIIFLLCFIAITVLFLFFRYQISNWFYDIRMLGVKKDFIIERIENDVYEGGYANTFYKYYIDIDKKKIYKTEDYYVFGNAKRKAEAGHHYHLKKTKKLKDDVIEELIQLTQLKSDYDESANNSNKNVYFLIKYQDKEIKLKPSTANVIEQIINDLK